MSSTLGQSRLLSLDMFRGLTIAGMILVNDPGSWSHVYAPLRHASWDGCTPTDLVFPFFVFIVGVSMFFSLGKYDHQLNGEALRKIGKRTVLIFLIGLFLTWFPFYQKPFSEYRIMNVLQRIALAYGFGSVIALLVPARALWSVIGGILLFYWGSMWALGSIGDPFSLEGNFARWLDLSIMGPDHLYQGYGIPFDPEGLFHSIPAVATALLGYQTGRLIKSTPERTDLVRYLLIAGTLACGLGLFWDLGFPINKPIWSSSYVVYTAGLAAIVLGLCVQYYDVYGGRIGRTFLEVFGTNALFAYVLHGFIAKISYSLLSWEDADGGSSHPLNWIYQKVFAGLFGDGNFASLLYAICYVLLCWGITYLLYRKRIFVKI
ncbi:hypothetical protein CEQ90_14380 [Lewinellaceae bacterium SD302]|nr:hypothetical protein CEQ90_14380 [Lewinellaceae bacterium SD302]